MAEEKRAVILFADIQKSTEFGFTQPIARYNAMLREFHALARRVVDAYAEENGLNNSRLMKGVKGDECCLFFLNGKPGQDELHAINLAVHLKEEWKASDFSKLTRAGAEAILYPLVDLRIGIGAGNIMMQHDDWAGRDTPEGIAISEAKRIEGMADGAENTLIMVSWEVHQVCAKSNPELVFGDGVRLTGKGIPEGMNTPVYPVKTYPPWREIQEAVTPKPEAAWELFDRALALRNSGDLDGAIEQYKKAVQQKADYHDAWYNMGNAHADKGEHDRAIECYRKAVDIKPDDYRAWNNMGIAYGHKEDYDRAIECYRKALDIKPDKHEAWNNMGSAYDGKKDYDRAIECYRKALDIKPDIHEAWNNMGSAYDDKKDYDRAIECYQRAVEVKPDEDEAWNNMGVAYAHKGEYDRAIECCQKAIAIKPDYGSAWFNLGCAYSLQGDAPLAVEKLARAIELDDGYREKAKADSDFNPIRNDPAFRKLAYSEEQP